MILLPRSCLCLAALIAISPAPITAQVPDTIRMRLVWEVAEGSHPAADSLGDLSGIAVDQAGNVYVADFAAATVWVFDARGRQQPSIGRKGRGPGEFEAPTGLGISPDGRLHVRDITRVSYFGLDSTSGRLVRYEGAFTSPSRVDWRSTLATRFDRAGQMYYPAFNTADRSRQSGWYLRFSTDGKLLDSLVVPPFANGPRASAHVCLNNGQCRMLRGLNHVPFAPLPTWDVTPRGTLLIGDGHHYDIQETDFGGRVLQTYRR